MSTKVRIVSGGTGATTEVYIDGRLVDCLAVEWFCAGGEVATATVTFDQVAVDVTGHQPAANPGLRTVFSRMSEPTLSVDGQALVYASARPVSMVVTHSCVIPEGDR